MQFDALRGQLARRGMPGPYIDRVCSELIEHWEDAAADLKKQGFTGEDATRLARERLGDPLALADTLSARRLDSSLWLRYQAVTALGLPIVSFLALSSAQLLVFYSMRDSISPVYFDGAQLLARVCIALAAFAGLHRFLAARIARRWVAVALVVLLIVSVTSVVRVERHSHDSGEVLLRLIP